MACLILQKALSISKFSIKKKDTQCVRHSAALSELFVSRTSLSVKYLLSLFFVLSVMTLSLGFASVNHGESHLLIWMQMKVLSFLEMYIRF